MKVRFSTLMAVVLWLGFLPTAHAEGDTNFKVFWKEGLRLETADKVFKMKIGGRIHNDWVWWTKEEDTEAELTARGIDDDVDDGVEFRRARLYIAGEMYEHVIFKAEYDFVAGDSALKDVFVGLKDVPAVGMIRVGHFKEPFSLEELTSANYITFLERGLPNIFVPSRNTGFGINTPLLDNRMTVGVGVFRDSDDITANGVGDNYQFSGRLTGLPMYANDGEQLVHLGFSYRYQSPDDDTLRIRQRPEVHLAPRFVDTLTFGTEDLNTYGFEAAGVFGPFSVQGEYMLADISSQAGDDPIALPDTDDPSLSGWYILGSWLVTGEHRLYKTDEAAFAGVMPNNNFDMHGSPVAIELAARYSSIDLDDEGVSGGELDDVTLGVNWYLNHNARVMFNYIYADLDGVDDASHAFTTRFQINI